MAMTMWIVTEHKPVFLVRAEWAPGPSTTRNYNFSFTTLNFATCPVNIGTEHTSHTMKHTGLYTAPCLQ